MAGDWIKVQHTTPDKPEVVAMATALGIDQDAVVGKLLRLWIWADQQTIDGNALSVTPAFLDRLTFCPGFSVAACSVGWLVDRQGRLQLPHFDRHNGQTAKSRALTSVRVNRSRKCNAPTVTESLPEKRREEKNLSLITERERARTNGPPESLAEAVERPSDGPAQWAADERRLIEAWNACPRGVRGVVPHRGLYLSPKLREAFREAWSDPDRREAMFAAVAAIRSGTAFGWERPALSLARFLDSDEIDKILGGGHARHSRSTSTGSGAQSAARVYDYATIDALEARKVDCRQLNSFFDGADGADGEA